VALPLLCATASERRRGGFPGKSMAVDIRIIRSSTDVNMWAMASLPTIADSCPPLLGAALTERQAGQLAAALKVLADPARLRLLSLIQAQPEGEACVCRLTQPLGLSQPTVSHHLKVLHDAGLLEREKRGSWVYYRLVPEGLAGLRRALA
jgi:ArsR family transcriptional regulator